METLSRRALISGAALATVPFAATAQQPNPAKNAVIDAAYTHSLAVIRAVKAGKLRPAHLIRLETAAATLFEYADEVGYNGTAPALAQRAILANPGFLNLNSNDILPALHRNAANELGNLFPLPVASPKMSDIAPLFSPDGMRQHQMNIIAVLNQATQSTTAVAFLRRVQQTGPCAGLGNNCVPIGTGLATGGIGLVTTAAAANAMLGTSTAAAVTVIGLAAVGGAFIVVGLGLVIAAWYTQLP